MRGASGDSAFALKYGPQRTADPESDGRMMPLLILAAVASTDLDALDQAVARCDRKSSNPVFSAEAARRSDFLLNAFHEQEAIVNERLELSDQRRAWRETPTSPVQKLSDQKQAEKQFDLRQAALDDRQKALNDQRLLEGMRQDAMDSMRRYFLSNCPAGEGEKSK